MSTQTLEEIWQARAACRGPQAAVFFPPTHAERKEEKQARETRAKAICSTCVVRRDCLDVGRDKVTISSRFWAALLPEPLSAASICHLPRLE